VHDQTIAYAAMIGAPVQEIDDANHFTILDELASPDGALTETLVRLAT
jgi:hypothetical protein